MFVKQKILKISLLNFDKYTDQDIQILQPEPFHYENNNSYISMQT